MVVPTSLKSYSLALRTLAMVAVLVVIRAVLWSLGVEGIAPTTLASSIVGGGIFVMGLVIAGTLSDYKDAERAPTDLAAGLYSILRESESMHRVWGKPNLPKLRDRLVAIVDALRRDIDTGTTRECQEAVEALSESFLEMEDTDVPANYIVRLRSEQAALRKSVVRIYHIQREEFLPSAYAMIVSFVIMIITLLMFTKIEGQIETLVTLAFLSFFFLYLLQLLNVINKPFKVGQERGDDDVSLFLLYEFVVHARLADQELDSEQIVAIAELVEKQEASTSTFAPGDGTVEQDATTGDAPVVDLEDAIDTAAGEVASPTRGTGDQP
jgi:hypothetical protein